MQKDVEEAFLHQQEVELSCVSYEFSNWDTDPYFEQKFPEYLLKDSYDMVFSINFFPVLSDLCQKFHIPYVSWVYDAPMHIRRKSSLANSCNYVFLYDRGQCTDLQKQGYQTIYHMPLGANVERLDQMEISYEDIGRFFSDISFVGKLYYSDFEDLLKLLPETDQKRLMEMADRQFVTYGDYFLDRELEESYMEHLNEYFRVSDWLGCRPVKKEELEYAMSTYITRRERMEALKRLSLEHTIDLYSNEKVNHLEKVREKGVIKYYSEMPKAFRLSKINLNISLKMIKEGIPLRVFDILGAGGFLITNYQKELEDCFTIGKDLVVYETMEDLRDKVRYYLSHEEERQSIARSGHDRVMEKFTIEAALKKILDVVKKDMAERTDFFAPEFRQKNFQREIQTDDRMNILWMQASFFNELETLFFFIKQLNLPPSAMIMIPFANSDHAIQYYYARKIESMLIKAGYQVRLIQIVPSADPLFLQAYMTSLKADLLITIDGCGFDLKMLGDDLFYTSLTANSGRCMPQIHMITKHPWMLEEELRQRMNIMMNFFVFNKKDALFIEKYVPNLSSVQILSEKKAEEAPLFDEEEINRLIQHGFYVHGKSDLGNQLHLYADYVSSERLRSEIQKLPEVFAALAVQTAEELTRFYRMVEKEEAAASPWEIMEEQLRQLNFEVSKEEFCSMMSIAAIAEDYADALLLEEVMEFFVKNRFHITLHGSGWAEYQSLPEDALILEDIEFGYDELIDLLNETKGMFSPISLFAKRQWPICLLRDELSGFF